jgi:hypothetical protein
MLNRTSTPLNCAPSSVTALNHSRPILEMWITFSWQTTAPNVSIIKYVGGGGLPANMRSRRYSASSCFPFCLSVGRNNWKSIFSRATSCCTPETNCGTTQGRSVNIPLKRNAIGYRHHIAFQSLHTVRLLKCTAVLSVICWNAYVYDMFKLHILHVIDE